VVERDNAGPDFTAFVAFVRSGPIRRYRGGRYHCVEVDQWAYWLTHAGTGGWIVNRKRSAEAGWDDVPPTRDRHELIWHDVERELISRERAEELLRELGRPGAAVAREGPRVKEEHPECREAPVGRGQRYLLAYLSLRQRRLA
jgi:hypothetical protein